MNYNSSEYSWQRRERLRKERNERDGLIIKRIKMPMEEALNCHIRSKLLYYTSNKALINNNPYTSSYKWGGFKGNCIVEVYVPNGCRAKRIRIIGQ